MTHALCSSVVIFVSAIRELFPGIDSSGSLQLTVVTLSRKKFGVAKKGNDNEHNAKTVSLLKGH